MKRFSETLRWEEPWYRNLKPRYKCLFEYLWSRCDSAGVWVVDLTLAATFVGEKMDLKEALSAFSGKVVDLKNGKWLLPEFIKIQCGKLSPNSPPHRRVIECLFGHSLVQNTMNEAYPTNTLSDRLSSSLEEEEEEEEKEEEQEKKGECEGGEFSPPTELEVMAFARESGKSEGQVLPFINFYESNGWKVGKNPMKKWKSAFAGWVERNQTYGNGNHSQGGNGAHSQRPSPADERNRFIIGADETRRAIAEESERRKREPKPWDKLP